MRLRFSLFTKILVWFFVKLVVLGVVFLVFFNLQFRFAPDSLLSAASGNRVGLVARSIADEMRTAAPGDRDAILHRYSTSYRVEFLLYANSGEKLAGGNTPLPAEISRRLAEMMPPLPPGPPSRGQSLPPSPPGRPFPPGEVLPLMARGPDPVFTLRTINPTRYWAGVRFLAFDPGGARPVRATLLAVSDSMTGHGLFFDPKPWIFIIALVLSLSILLWLPFVRTLTLRIRQMTAATERIAEEHFETRVDERRSDELGRLGAAINQMAVRLANFVGGQKRFLGDISHELNTPLARLQLALDILEERVDAPHKGYVADAQEEVRLMAHLVNNILAFARAGMKTAEIQLVRVPLLPFVQEICAREAGTCQIKIEIAENLAALAHPELLSRALANVLRNAARYAGEGTLGISVRQQHDKIRISIADQGPGVPPETLSRLFDPFYRLEPDRARTTGGSGLGLAIVKTCVEACQGTVAARNLNPSGLEISILLQAALSVPHGESGPPSQSV